MPTRWWNRLVALLALSVLGCSGTHAIYDSSLDELEAVRDRVRSVEVVLIGEASVQLREPARGVWGGAKRGMVLGAAWPVVIGFLTPIPFGFLFGLALTPLGSLVGSVVGASLAPPAETVDRAAAEIQRALQEDVFPGFGGRLRDEVISLGLAKTGLRFSRENGTADAILELLPRTLGLRGPYAIDPLCSVYFELEVRLVRPSDRHVYLAERYLCASEEVRSLLGWADGGALHFKGEARRFARELSEKIVDDMFLTIAIRP